MTEDVMSSYNRAELAEKVKDYLNEQYHMKGTFNPDKAALEIVSLATEHFRKCKEDRMTEEKDFGMTAGEIQRELLVGLDEAASDEAKICLAQFAHLQMMALHARALACHCECLGMNAENSKAVCGNLPPPYSDDHYNEVMQKWGLIDEEGELLI